MIKNTYNPIQQMLKPLHAKKHQERNNSMPKVVDLSHWLLMYEKGSHRQKMSEKE
jgi:hypothetical protein